MTKMNNVHTTESQTIPYGYESAMRSQLQFDIFESRYNPEDDPVDENGDNEEELDLQRTKFLELSQEMFNFVSDFRENFITDNISGAAHLSVLGAEELQCVFQDILELE